jgi:glycosyltransferase involved in cell wall biosynthesis
VASPYDLECFRRADIIITYSQAWARFLKEGRPIPGLNPAGKKFRNVVAFHQCIGSHFKPTFRHFPERIKRRIGADFIIGHFGRLGKTNYPYYLSGLMPILKRKYGRVKVLTAAQSGKFDHPDIYKMNIRYWDIPMYLCACDVVIIGQFGLEWDICGNLKTKEAAACGVPVIVGRSFAREEEFGIDYKLFMPRGFFKKYYTNQQTLALAEKIFLGVSDKSIAINAMKRMSFYSIENGALRLKIIMDKLLGGHYGRA